MAIVKMKKLRLMVIRAEKDRLLQDLERFGCVEFAVMDDRLCEEGLYQESADTLTLRSTQNAIQNAIALLDRYAPRRSRCSVRSLRLRWIRFLTRRF